VKPVQARIKRADYGIDAPTVVRNFFLIGIAGWIVGTILANFGSGHLPNWLVSFYGACLGIGTCFVLQGLVMVWGSKVGKLHLRDKMIDSVSWRGDEQVLDVGCGHGLMLIGAAKRLTTGHALGIDIWQQEDQASNSSRATLENALREGVADRVELRDSDARELPFDRAKEVLRDPNKSVLEASARTGFVDQSHFTKIFRRIVGVTPSQFRSEL
jgi:SAM-dependent methyltransferase